MHSLGKRADPIKVSGVRISPSPSPLEFWFDFASTYSYVAAMRIDELCRDAGVELIWKPFSLGPIFERQGWNDSDFSLNPMRGAYMWRDLERLPCGWRVRSRAKRAAAASCDACSSPRCQSRSRKGALCDY